MSKEKLLEISCQTKLCGKLKAFEKSSEDTSFTSK